MSEKAKHRESGSKSGSRGGSGGSSSKSSDKRGEASPAVKKVKDDRKEKESESASLARMLTNFTDEDELETHQVPVDVQEHANACDLIRAVMEKIRRIKDSGKTSSDSLLELRAEAAQQFITLKRLNRVGHLRVQKARDATAEKKGKVDSYHLKLQNLLYEVIHLQKEINKCLEFKSEDEDINLVPVEEFLRDAPEDMAQAAKENPHEERKARLAWELEQRKSLDESHKAMEANQEAMAGEIAKKRDYLDSLQPKLKTILDSTKPVQDYLDMPLDKIRDQHAMAAVLPHPLYVLYVQTCAYQEACEGKQMSVTIEGDVDAAKAENERQAALRAGKGSRTRENGEEDEDDEEEVKGQRGVGEGGKRGRRKKDKSDKETERSALIQKQHPLRVAVILHCKDGSSLDLTFHYLTFFKIVTVQTSLRSESRLPSIGLINSGNSGSGSSVNGLLDAQTLLDCLMEAGDLGMDSPNAANRFHLTSIGGELLSLAEEGEEGESLLTPVVAQTGKPYLWAQRMSGLQFLSPAPRKSESEDVHSNAGDVVDNVNDEAYDPLADLADDEEGMDVEDDEDIVDEDNEDQKPPIKSSLSSMAMRSSPSPTPVLKEEITDVHSSSSRHSSASPSPPPAPSSSKLNRSTSSSAAAFSAAELSTVFQAVRPKTAIAANSMEATIKALRARVVSRIALANQLQSLYGVPVPLMPPSSSRSRSNPPPPPAIVLPSQIRPLFPKKISSRLDHFESVTWPAFSDADANPHVQQLLDAQLLDSSNYFFRAILSHAPAGSGAIPHRLEALISLPASYPVGYPLFALRLLPVGSASGTQAQTHLNNDGIRDIERELNLYPDDLINKAAGNSKSLLSTLRNSLLSVQLQRLLVCLDIFVETSSSGDRGTANEVATSQQQGKILVRRNRGPARNRPYQFNADLGFFYQR